MTTIRPASANSSLAALSDPELASRVATGDHEAFTLLMRRYNQSLFRAARSVLKDDAEAEDAVQEAYLLAYRGMSKYRGDAKLSTWMMRIVVNEAIARRRKRSRHAEVIRLDGDTEGDSAATGTNMNEATPEQGTLRAELRLLLEKKIDALPDGFRTVFLLRAVEDLSVEEVAIALDMPEATVRTRFFRARGLLREALASEIDGAYEHAFAFAGARCDRIVAGVLARLVDSKAPGA